MQRIAMRAVILFAAVSTSSSWAVDTLNLGPIWGNLQQKASTGSADVVIFGDSLSMRPGTYSPYFRTALQNALGNAGIGYNAVSGGSTAGFYSGAWSGGMVNGDNAPHNGLDGFWTVGESGYGYFDVPTSQSTLLYGSTPTSGSVALYLKDAQNNDITLGTLNTASGDGTSGVKSLPLNLPAGNTRVYMHPLENGPVTLLGVQDVPVTSGVRVSVAANGGWTAQNFLNRNYTFDGILSNLTPDSAFILLGQNDHSTYTPEQFRTNILAMVNRLKAAAPGMDITLVSTYDSGSQTLADYATVEAELAASQNLGFINLYALGGSYQSFLTNGYLDDGVHFSPSGGQYVSNVLFGALTSAQVPEPASLAVLGIGAAALLGRRRRSLPG
jgi:lysophospholipase L1-like esterase